VDIRVEAVDRQGLLRDITGILANEKVNVLAVQTGTDKQEHMAHMRLTLEVNDVAQLSRLLDKIGHLSNVVEAERVR
jgi:GTP pyrophosphokinase